MTILPTFCDFDPGSYLVFGPNVGPLQYYSHLPVIVIALALAIFVLWSNRKLAGSIFFFTISSFVLWVFFDSIIWASNRSDVIMFMWSLQILVEPLVYLGCLYLIQVLVTGKDISFKSKLFWILAYLPLILLTPTNYILESFDLSACLANETYLSYYTYGIEIVAAFWILWFANKESRRASKEKSREISLLTAGIILFLVAFAWGNIIGSLTGDWELAQYGLFGMPVFTAFLVYSIVKFKAFNIKLVGASALVFGLIAATFSLIFVNEVEVFRGVALVTFVLSLIFGYILIKSINREAKQRQEIEQLAKDLEETNKQQIILVHFLTHQIKGFVSKSRNIFSMVLDGDFGPVPEAMKPIVEEGLKSDTKGVDTIQEILNAANIKSGKISYTKTEIDLTALVTEIVQELKIGGDIKGIAIDVSLPPDMPKIMGDKLQLHNAFKNLIDNSIKYTPSGSVEVTSKEEEGTLQIIVKDTGVGITEGDMKNLFTQGGHGKDSQKINVDSTGFGLFIVKNIIESHGGKVWATSEGAGKGSMFTVELPVVVSA